MRPIARLLDLVICLGSCTPGNIVGTKNYTVFVDNLPVATMGDITSNCCVGDLSCWCPHNIVTGSYTFFVNNQPVARLGDIATRGVITTGSYSTFV